MKTHELHSLKSHELLDAVGYIRDDYIKDAERTSRAAWKKLLPAAACLCAAAVLAIAASALRSHGSMEDSLDTSPVSGSTAAAVHQGVTIPKLRIEKPDESAAMDMIAFFIYNGRCYSECGRYPGDLDLIGEHLGTATGTIDEWSGPEDYVEYSGSIGGDFYSVKGYSPDFMLCMRSTDGTICIFINDNGITVSKGSDIFEDRFRISDTCTAVRYQSDDSWFYSKNEFYTLTDIDRDEVREFVAAIDDGVCELYDQEKFENELSTGHRTWHVYFDSDSGISMRVIVYDSGYVAAAGLTGVCVRVDPERIAPFIELLESGEDSRYSGASDSLTTSFEDCASDAYLGRYVPRGIPDRLELQYAWKGYSIDIPTGALIRTESLSLSYSGEGYCDINIYDPRYFDSIDGGEGCVYDAVCDIGELSPEYIGNCMQTESADHHQFKYPQVNLCVRYDGAVVSVYAGGLTPDEIYSMLRSAG